MLALSVEVRSEKEETDKAGGGGGLKPFCYNFTKVFSKVLTTSYGFLWIRIHISVHILLNLVYIKELCIIQ